MHLGKEKIMVEKKKLEQLNRIDVQTFKETSKIPLVVLLDDVRSMHNVGSLFRTADAFLIEKIILCGITPTPPHREIQKAALGATQSVDWEHEADICQSINKLKEEGYHVFSVEQTSASQSLEEIKLDKQKKYAIILGNEVDGVSDAAISQSDGYIEIPQHGTKHSLNVSICGGIVLWEFFKKLM